MQEKIKKRLKEHYEFVCSKYDKDQILGVFLYGSQNYDLATEFSDIDTKAIYVPSFEEVIWNKPISIELQFENGEHCEVKDIRDFMKNIYKQNINFIEVLFTEYFILNPKYVDLWNELLQYKEDYARYDIHKAVHSMSHQASNTLKQALNSPTNPSKKASDALRLIYFLQRYLHGESYFDCIKPVGEARDEILSIKYSPRPVESYRQTIQILQVILNYYKQSDFTQMNNQDLQLFLEKRAKEIVEKMIHLNF